MKDDIQEPKETAEDKAVNSSIDETIDNFMSGEKDTPSDSVKESNEASESSEQSEDEVKDDTLNDSSPENKEAEESEDTGTEPDKTDKSKEDSEDYKGMPKGYANNPIWQKREQKLKDTQLGKEQAESQLNQLLADPSVYQRHLERQGKDKDEVIHSMRDKGMDVSKLVQSDGNAANKDILQDICKRQGWDMEKLEEGQKDYLRDIFTAVDTRMNDMLDKRIAEKIGPIENHVKLERDLQAGRKEFDAIQDTAKEEFPNLDWHKDIKPAMNAYLDHLDKIDPEAKKFRPTHMEVYEKATRQILIDISGQKVRQEDRNDKKKNARPLRPGGENIKANKSSKGRTLNETVDNYMADHGWSGE